MTITDRDPVDLQEFPPVSHREATEPAREAYRRLAADLAALDVVDWARPTDCDEWDVRAMAGHVLGAMQGASSMRENLSQLRAAAKRGGNQVDALSAEQIDRNEHLDPAEVAAGMEALVDDAAARADHRAQAEPRRSHSSIEYRSVPPVTPGGRAAPWPRWRCPRRRGPVG